MSSSPVSSTDTAMLGLNKPRSKRKKIVIRPYSKPPQVPPDFYETQSKLVLESTLSLLKEKQSSDLQSAHGRVLDLVAHKYASRFYSDLVPSLKEAAAIVLPYSSEGMNLLEYIPQQYALYTNYLSVVRHVCLPLDRQYLWNGTEGVARGNSSTPNLMSLWQVGLHVFYQRLQELQLGLYEAWWCELWADYLECASMPRPSLAKVVMVWHELGCKSTVILQQLEPQLKAALTEESRQWQATPAFLNHVYGKWLYISQKWTFLPRVWCKGLVEQYLLEPHMAQLLDELTFDSLDHVERLWTLSSSSPKKQEQVSNAILAHAKTRGMACLKEPDFKKSIPALLKLQSLLKTLSTRLGTSLQVKTVWTTIMREDTAEPLAKYMDFALKQKTGSPPLEQVFQLFCWLPAKDVFEAFYKQDLAKRLLQKRIQSMEVERQFVSLLKSECGAGYTSKMEGMFQDVEWSRETMALYHSSLTEEADGGVDVDVQVLTTGYWPVYPKYQLNLPEALEKKQEHFTEYYKKTYQGRRIAWQYYLGQCTVKAKFPSKTYDLVMSLSLALVLLEFANGEAKWSLPQLSQKIGLTDRVEMERILKTLSLGKVKLLKKWDHDATEGQKPRANVHEDDWFTLNEEFSSPLKKIKISLIASSTHAAASAAERKKTLEAVSRDRLYLLDAVLVRILKARKTMLHSDLIPLVMEHAKVPCTPTDIKGRIESLMDREYLERDESDRNRYNYLA